MNDSDKDGLDAAMFLAELVRDVLYNQERYKLYARVYSNALAKAAYPNSAHADSAHIYAKLAVRDMDLCFEPMNDAPTEEAPIDHHEAH
jgi:hypothetical protein